MRLFPRIILTTGLRRLVPEYRQYYAGLISPKKRQYYSKRIAGNMGLGLGVSDTGCNQLASRDFMTPNEKSLTWSRNRVIQMKLKPMKVTGNRSQLSG